MSATPSMPSSAAPRAKAVNVGLWVVRILFGLVFLAAGGAKLAGVPQLVAEFEQVGLGQWFRYLTGLIEIAGGIMLIWPRTVFYGASLLTLVSLGALVAQVTAIHQDWVHCVVFAAVLGTVAWTYRPTQN